MTDKRCVQCYSDKFDVIRNKTYCYVCGAESLEPWSSLEPELRKIFMKVLHKDFNWDNEKMVSGLPALAEYLKEINSQDEEQEVPLILKNCLSCNSENLKPYQGKAFCLDCARICEDRRQ